MTKLRESGSAQAIVIFLLAVCWVGAVGYIIWQKNDETKTTSAKTSTTTSDKTEKTSSDTEKPYYEGTRVSSSKGAFSVVVPNGWALTNDTTSDWLSSGPSLDKLTYDATASPTITEVAGGGWDGYTQHFYIQKTPEDITPEGSSADFTLDTGTVGKKYTNITPKGTTSEIYGTLEDDYYAYSYVFKKNTTQILVAFSVYGATTFDRTLVDEVVKTLIIN